MNEFKSKIEEIESYKRITISGLNEGEKAFLPYFFHGKMMIVAPSETEVLTYENMLKAMGKKVISFSRRLPLLITLNDRFNIEFRDFLNGLNSLATRDFDFLVVTPEALFQKLPNKESLVDRNIVVQKNKDCDMTELTKRLVGMGYSRTDIVSGVGDFAVRGDILDIFCVNHTSPVRISFFDNEVDGLNYFDPSTFKMTKELKKVEIESATLLNISKEEKEKIAQDVRENLQKVSLAPESMVRLSGIVDEQLELLKTGENGVSNVFFLPFTKDFGQTFFDYLADGDKVIFDEPKLILDNIKQTENENVSNFLELSVKGEFLPKNMEFYATQKEILAGIKKNVSLVAFSRLVSQNKIFESEHIVNFECQHMSKYFGRFVNLADDIMDYQNRNFTVVVSAKDSSLRRKIGAFLRDIGVEFFEAKNFDDVKDGKVNLLEQDVFYSVNFELQKFVLVGRADLVAHQAIRDKNVGTGASKFVPQVGQFVVHEVHGIGKCVGIENIKITDISRDYVVIEYQDGDKLYVPSENTDMLSLYSGSDSPRLNKIGGAEFYKIKQKVKSSIKAMAFDLLKVYGERLNAKGFVYSKDNYLQSAFESAFAFEYTVDQEKALEEIKKDMESTRIMDRLLCGDVGFGKTEVALAAAFKAIQDGKQVALVCPTTILCEQHFATAVSRMKNFMVDVGVINRFKTKKEQAEILENLQNGKINLICGTHRLLSKDVKFKDLGLVIIDEEQRFGVEDKEKLKNMKRTVDVLSLSATPIPRTLYMSLTGIRDVSFLSSAPKDRKKISTAVIDYSDNILVDACRKELARDGQVLIVYNRVETIGNFYAHIRALLPDVRIGLAHGQMPTKTLEKAIYDLYSRKTQILISTVLIENGIDLPYANTLFVIDADKLGLSQLYQLRGRIGRSDTQAYAYFSFSKNKVLSVDAYKRLDAIMEFSDFGSGYKLALRDLEIRGAGDVLGKSQHGHMQQVGFDLYVKLLDEAVKELKGEEVEEVREIKLDISLSAFVPEDYITSNDNRIVFYTKVSKLKDKNELAELLKETANKFGKVPEEVEQLCVVGLLKNLGQKVQAKRIVLNDFGAEVTFYPDIVEKPVFKFLSEASVDFVLKQDKMPIIVLKKEKTKLAQEKMLIEFLINCQKSK
jgi:transcription-repair coupling factor (superfamily II helicase)